jgi:PTH1 family peptidyl-tRNA hydrolase
VEGREPRKLVVGLGNPGPEYESTRHNVGFRILDRFAALHRFPGWHRKGIALESHAALDGERVALFKPLSFMNLSGRPVARRLAELGLGPADLLVCYDELVLPLGRLRLRGGGSSAGHNGVQSVIEALGTDAFPRLRFGVAPDGRQADQVRFLLSRFRQPELAVVEEALDRAAQAVACFCREGIVKAMNAFNSSSEVP